MINPDRLPSPPNRNAKKDLCAIAAFATATYPFCGIPLNKFLEDFKRYGETKDRICPKPEPADFYNANAKLLFGRFQAERKCKCSMMEWFEALQEYEACESFRLVSERCQREPYSMYKIREMKVALMDDHESVGIIGMAFQIAGVDKSHFVTTWYNEDLFFVLDSGAGGVEMDDGSNNVLEEAVTKCGLAAGRKIIGFWGMVMSGRTSANTAIIA